MTTSSVTVTEWRKIPGLPRHYEASREGQIRILDREVEELRNYNGRLRRTIRLQPGRIVKPYREHNSNKARTPFHTVSIQNSGNTRLNVLIARAFHGCPYEIDDLSERMKWRVRHLDGDTLNCHADNLEWAPKGNSNPAQEAAYDAAVAEWRRRAEEPVEQWVKRFWTDDEIDWSTADYIKLPKGA